MDELAASSGADPVEYRLRHLDDARARDVVATAAERFNWKGRTHGTPDRGSGFAFARYKILQPIARSLVKWRWIARAGASGRCVLLLR